MCIANLILLLIIPTQGNGEALTAKSAHNVQHEMKGTIDPAGRNLKLLERISKSRNVFGSTLLEQMVNVSALDHSVLGKPGQLSNTISRVSPVSAAALHVHDQSHFGRSMTPAQQCFVGTTIVGGQSKPLRPLTTHSLQGPIRNHWGGPIMSSRRDGEKEVDEGVEQFRQKLESTYTKEAQGSEEKSDSTSISKMLNFNRLSQMWNQFSNDLDENIWYLYQGRKEQRWQPDRRPESQQGISAGPGKGSQLTWGGAKSLEEYKEMCREQKSALKRKAAKMMEKQPMGEAAVAVFGESVKDDIEPDVQSKMFSEALLSEAQAPEGAARTIAGPVELAEMIHGKYGRYHDVAILRNAGQVGLNIYAPCLGQRSFSYTEEQYLEKLSSIIMMLQDLDQAWFVRNFLLSPLKPRMGLPSTPRTDTCVTLRLNLSPTWNNARDQEIVDVWLKLRR